METPNVTTAYDYPTAVTNDLREHYRKNRDRYKGISTPKELSCALLQGANGDPDVTGNMRRPRTGSNDLARSFVMGNISLLKEACRKRFANEGPVKFHLLPEVWSWLDRTIRTHLLPQAAATVASEALASQGKTESQDTNQ